MIALAKPAVDLGLFTEQREAMLDFWQREAGVPFSELLPLGGGVQQHRHAIGDTVLKINHARDPLPAAPPSGIRALSIAGAAAQVTQLADPDGNRVTLVPRGHDGIEQIRIHLVVSDLQRHQDFYGDILGLPERDSTTFLCGVSQLALEEGEAYPDPVQQATGYRYLTIQVYDVLGCHAEVLRKGGREGRPPVKLGDVAHISFVRDPDGNWIEVSQRKSITGTLD